MTVATKERVNERIRFNVKSVTTRESQAKGGRNGKGKSKIALQENLAEAVVRDAKEGTNKTAKQLLREAGYSERTVIGKPEVWNTQGLRDALARRGFTQDKMMKVLQEAAEAKIVTVFKGEAKETEAPDHAIRLRAVDQVADVMGLKKMNVQTINVDVKMEADDLKTMLGF